MKDEMRSRGLESLVYDVRICTSDHSVKGLGYWSSVRRIVWCFFLGAPWMFQSNSARELDTSIGR
jgi:hypothetical protein